MNRDLTVKQWKFAACLVGPAQGNQTVAARMAGYRGDNRQLAVQGSANMNNPRIRKLITEMLEAMVEPSLAVLGDGLRATKQRGILTKTGDVVYFAPEVDHRVRVATATRILDHYERASDSDHAGSDEGVVESDTTVVELPVLKERGADAQRGADGAIHLVDDLDTADRALLQDLEEIDAELAAFDNDPDGTDADE